MTSPLKTTESTLEASNDGIPTMYEELNRKTLDVALELVSNAENDNISAAQFYTGMNVLFGTVSGLASKEATEFAFEGSKMVAKYSDGSFFRNRFFFNKSAVDTAIVTVSYRYGDDFATVRVRDNKGDIIKEQLILKELLTKVMEGLIRSGYQELT